MRNCSQTLKYHSYPSTRRGSLWLSDQFIKFLEVIGIKHLLGALSFKGLDMPIVIQYNMVLITGLEEVTM